MAAILLCSPVLISKKDFQFLACPSVLFRSALDVPTWQSRDDNYLQGSSKALGEILALPKHIGSLLLLAVSYSSCYLHTTFAFYYNFSYNWEVVEE